MMCDSTIAEVDAWLKNQQVERHVVPKFRVVRNEMLFDVGVFRQGCHFLFTGDDGRRHGDASHWLITPPEPEHPGQRLAVIVERKAGLRWQPGVAAGREGMGSAIQCELHRAFDDKQEMLEIVLNRGDGAAAGLDEQFMLHKARAQSGGCHDLNDSFLEVRNGAQHTRPAWQNGVLSGFGDGAVSGGYVGIDGKDSFGHELILL